MQQCCDGFASDRLANLEQFTDGPEDQSVALVSKKRLAEGRIVWILDQLDGIRHTLGRQISDRLDGPLIEHECPEDGTLRFRIG